MVEQVKGALEGAVSQKTSLDSRWMTAPRIIVGLAGTFRWFPWRRWSLLKPGMERSSAPDARFGRG